MRVQVLTRLITKNINSKYYTDGDVSDAIFRGIYSMQTRTLCSKGVFDMKFPGTWALSEIEDITWNTSTKIMKVKFATLNTLHIGDVIHLTATFVDDALQDVVINSAFTITNSVTESDANGDVYIEFIWNHVAATLTFDSGEPFALSVENEYLERNLSPKFIIRSVNSIIDSFSIIPLKIWEFYKKTSDGSYSIVQMVDRVGVEEVKSGLSSIVVSESSDTLVGAIDYVGDEMRFIYTSDLRDVEIRMVCSFAIPYLPDENVFSNVVVSSNQNRNEQLLRTIPERFHLSVVEFAKYELLDIMNGNTDLLGRFNYDLQVCEKKVENEVNRIKRALFMPPTKGTTYIVKGFNILSEN